ncbi:site-specific DNA-methyltransferase [Patescibacteria group bacterium]|nr:site-specific DNA-methyltransferase [Patescibacteria group bacterium]MBU4579982.1 site-specific DNA-methyltransferase [Patescibacteria group bacterium]
MARKINYDNWSKEELIKELRRIKETKYGLVWHRDLPEEKIDILINPDARTPNEMFPNEMAGKPFPVLKEVKGKEIKGDKGKPVNLLIEGDNYHSLAVLNFTHQEAIDFIYIDPPYNTGARDWKYNNNFVDIADPFRHSKWLSLMEKRLKLAKNLLKEDGIICVTIDDNELAPLWMLMNEIFDEQNHLGSIAIRNNPGGRKTDRKVALVHEYALFFGKSSEAKISKIAIPPEEKTHTYLQDTDGSYYEKRNLRKDGIDSTAINKKGKLSERYYPIYFDPKTGGVSTQKKYKIEILPIDQKREKRIWRRAKEAIDIMFKDGNLWVKEIKGVYQIFYKFRGGLEGQMPKSIWYDSKFSASEYGTQILHSIMGQRELFQYPKSPYAVMECILAGTSRKNAIILDFFAGSGTTGQAVMELNKKDDGNRQFILCTNNENNICTDVCYPRVKKVIKGYKNSKSENVAGLGGNLKYYTCDFVKAEPTDKNKRKLVSESTEMLCIRENTFELVQDESDFKIFKNSDKYVGIIFYEEAISDFKKAIKKIKGHFNTYVFSLGDDPHEKQFADVKNKVTLCAIPEVILKVYREIFK